MAHIHQETICRAPLDVTFAYVDDYRNTPAWMFGVRTFVPAGERDHGLGAIFDATFEITPVKLHSTVEVIAWEHNRTIELDSRKGFSNRMRFTFAEHGEHETQLGLDLEYELPGGIAGAALAVAFGPVVALAQRHSDANLRRQVEQFQRA